MAEKKIFCPVDGSLLTEYGDQGIVDYDGNWDAQATRYDCADGRHSIFVVESEIVTELALPAYQEAENAVYEALRDARWNKDWKEVEIQVWNDNELVLGSPIKSMDDLRDTLAHIALAAFKDEVEESGDEDKYDPVEYEYIHAIEDVDDILEEYSDKLEELGWQRKEQPKT